MRNNAAETADVSNLYASFKDANGNKRESALEYYAGIYEWDNAIIGWQVQTICPGVKYKIRTAVSEGAIEVKFYG
ncbi:MAG: hypothetical protein Q8N37_00285 [bacterium]|nr:hypothetical protein [bacterium]